MLTFTFVDNNIDDLVPCTLFSFLNLLVDSALDRSQQSELHLKQVAEELRGAADAMAADRKLSFSTVPFLALLHGRMVALLFTVDVVVVLTHCCCRCGRCCCRRRCSCPPHAQSEHK